MSMKTIGVSIAFGAAIQGSLGSAFKTINEKSKGIENSLKKIGFKKDLAGNLKKTKRALYDLEREAKKTGNVSGGLKSKIKAARIEFAKAKGEAYKYGISLKNAYKMQKAFDKLGQMKSLNALSINKAVSRKDYRANAKGQIFDKLAIGMAVAAPFKAGIEFESSMKRVQALSGATDEDFKRLESTAKKLGATTTFSASQSAQAMQYLSMAGFKTNDTIKAMPGLLALAAAGQTDLATTADITSNILTGFGISADKTGHIADVMAKAATSANVNVSMLGETMKYVAPSASGLGSSLEEVTTLTAKLGDAGIQATNAGTALRSMYVRMASPPAEAAKMIDQLGLKTKDSNGKFVGMINILGELQEKTKGMSNTAKADVMKKLFGVEAMSGATALMKVPIEQLKKYEKSLKNADGTAQKIAKKQNDSVAGAFKALSSAIEGVSISATTLFLPALKGITVGLASTTRWLNSFIENHKTLATVVGGVAGGMIALSVAAFGLRYAFSFVADGFGSLWRAGRSVVFWMSAEGRMLAWNRAQLIATAIKTKALAFWQGVVTTKTKVMALWTARGALAQKGAALASGAFSIAIKGVGLAFRFALGPVGLIITGISLVTAGVVWAYHKFDWFRNGVNKAWGFIKKVFSFSPFGIITKIWGKVFDWLGSKFAWFGKAVDKLKSIGSGIADFLGFGDDKKIEVGKTVKHIVAGTAMTAQMATAAPVVAPKLATAKPVTPKLATVKPVAPKTVSNISQKKQIHSVQNRYNNVSQTMQKRQSSSSHHTYNITVQVQSGNPKDIANEVKKTIAQMESSRKNRSFNDEEI